MRRSLGFAILLSCYGTAVGAQPVMSGSMPLPVSVGTLASGMGLGQSDPSTVLLRVARLVYEAPYARSPQARAVRDALRRTLALSGEQGQDAAPLPLDLAIWRDTILQTPVTADGLASAILTDRRSALLYVGLAALDEETLAWLGSQRDTLLHVRKHPGLFAAFGRSFHVHAGRIGVPGGAEAEPLWKAIAGANPEQPAAFIEKVIEGDGRLAFLYDTIAHLDAPRQRFALGLQLQSASRAERLRALLDTFAAAAPDWRPEDHPFSRPPVDGAILLSTVAVTPKATAVAPFALGLWERVLRKDALMDVKFQKVSDSEALQVSHDLSVDAAWLASRVLRVPYALGRRRLDTFLFGQRVFAGRPPSETAIVATALRGYLAFPALMIAFERSGIKNPATFALAAEHAARLNAIDSLSVRRTSIAEFQSAVALIEHARRTGVLGVAKAESLLSSLSSLDPSPIATYDSRFSGWLRDEFARGLNAAPTLEERVLGAMAGPPRSAESPPAVVEWEGRAYQADPARAELQRLRLVRQRQGGATLDDALAVARGEKSGAGDESGNDAGRVLADTLMSIVYAAYLGDPEGAAVTSGNVALRHDFGIAVSASGSAEPWRLPIEHFDGKAAWRIRGSLLGLETALARLALRRIDPMAMPGEPKLGPQDRQTVMLTAALLNPFTMTDAARDQIAASIARGRARVASLSDKSASVDDLARDAGLSEWRARALAWSIAHGHEVLSQFSLLELLWLGSSATDSAPAQDAWGAAALPLTGCVCLAMPHAGAWEDLGGRASAVLATRGSDVALQIAETLAALKLPASLAPALAGYVTQDVIEHAQLAYPDDWQEFERAARDLPRERMFDYIAALTAGGPLVDRAQGSQ